MRKLPLHELNVSELEKRIVKLQKRIHSLNSRHIFYMTHPKYSRPNEELEIIMDGSTFLELRVSEDIGGMSYEERLAIDEFGMTLPSEEEEEETREKPEKEEEPEEEVPDVYSAFDNIVKDISGPYPEVDSEVQEPIDIYETLKRIEVGVKAFKEEPDLVATKEALEQLASSEISYNIRILPFLQAFRDTRNLRKEVGNEERVIKTENYVRETLRTFWGLNYDVSFGKDEYFELYNDINVIKAIAGKGKRSAYQTAFDLLLTKAQYVLPKKGAFQRLGKRTKLYALSAQKAYLEKAKEIIEFSEREAKGVDTSHLIQKKAFSIYKDMVEAHLDLNNTRYALVQKRSNKSRTG